jgi:ribosomal protein L37E
MMRTCERCGRPSLALLFHLCARCIAVVDRIYTRRGRNRVEVEC